MGYLFANIAQLADYFIGLSQPAGNAGAKPASDESRTVDFESLLAAISNGLNPDSIIAFSQSTPGLAASFGRHTLNSAPDSNLSTDQILLHNGFIDNFGSVSENPPLIPPAEINDDLKSAERIGLDSRIVEVYVSRSTGTASIEISSFDAGALLETNLPSQPGQSSPLYADSILYGSNKPSTFDQSNFPALTGNVRVSFAAADLLKAFDNPQGSIDIEYSGEGRPSRSGQIELPTLISLLRNYPEPVRIEIPMIPMETAHISQVATPTQNDGYLKSSFIFDLRQLINTDNRLESRNIDGLLTFSGTPPPRANRLAPDDESARAKTLALFSKSNIDDRQAMSRTTGQYDLDFTGGHDASEAPNAPIQNRRSPADFGLNLKSHGAGDRGYTPIKPAENNPGVLFDGFETPNTPVLLRDRAMLYNMEAPDARPLANLARPVPNMNEIESAIFYAVRRNVSTVRLKLQPEEFGNVDIKLHVKDGILSAEMKVGNAQAFKALNSGLAELRSGLEQFSLRINDINLILDHNMNFNSGGTDPDSRPGMAAWSGHNKNNRFKNSSVLIRSADRSVKIGTASHSTVHKGWIDLKA